MTNTDHDSDLDAHDERASRRGPWSKRWWRWGLFGVILIAAVASMPAIWVHMSSSPYQHGRADVPSATVGIVFGAKVSGEKASPFLAGRLDLASDLYRTGKVRVLLVSGDNSTKNYDEPDVMRQYLINRGVPANAVVTDYAGFDTWDSCARAHRIFGVDHAILVSQSFHIPRAIALCRANGIDAYGVGDDSSAASESMTIYGRVREFFADDKAMWQALVTKPEPHFLGPKEAGITDALAGH